MSIMPENIKMSLDNYATKRIPTGSFLYAVLTNNLFETISRADKDSLAALFAICNYVYNEMPSTCRGTPAKVREWLEGRKGG